MSMVELAAYLGLFVGFWHEVNRFPAANKTFQKLQDRLASLEAENSQLENRLAGLEWEVMIKSKAPPDV